MKNYLRTQITLYEEDKNYPIWRRQERRSKYAVQLASWQLRSNSPKMSVHFTIWEKGKEELSPLQYHFKSLHIISRHYKKSLLRSQIYHGYEELSTDKNYPIWRRQKLPYMKKTRKKKQVCGAACFMAAEIKFSEDVRPWVGVRMITLILFSGFKKFFLHISLGSRSCMGLNISVLPH